jgi:hypothetical protein
MATMTNIEDMLSGKERLKFGDKEQIEAIDERRKEQEKNLYSVVIHVPGSAEFEVRADNKEDAMEWARDKLSDYDISVELIEEGEKS